MKFIDPEEIKKNNEEESQPAEVYSEIAEPEMPEIDDAQIRALALAYARYLKEHDLVPGDATYVEPEEIGVSMDGFDVEFDIEFSDDEDLPVSPEEQLGKELFGSVEVSVDEPDENEEAPVEEPADETTEEDIPEEASVEESVEEESCKDDEPSGETEEISVEEAAPEEIPDEDPTEESSEEPIEEEAAEEPSEEAVEKVEAPAEKKEKKEDPKKKAAKEARERAALKKIRKRNRAKERQKEKFLKGGKVPLAAITNLHDKIQDGIDGAFITVGKQAVSGAHKISSTYTHSRKGIGIAVLITGLLAASILVVFDMFTIYEYSYNGKVLGYVKNQEEVTDVLDVAGRQLTYNSSTEADVKFVANQNITFNPVDGRGKSTDDSDTVVNKLIYMTDIETEAYAVYDGDKVVAIVKDQNEADNLLLMTKADLSIPDRGMELVSSEFLNELSVKPVNVLLGSIQSNAAAQSQMTNGGEMNTYHIVEDGETVHSLATLFGVEDFDIYNENNTKPVNEIETGDRVCIRSVVSPVQIEMVEKGRIKEVIEFETIKKESDEYYKGDSFLAQEGQDGIEIFEGYITKVAGEETERKATAKPEVLRKKKNKIIVVGTAERPKTAATGTFIVPLDHYVVTSEWGGRWGRMHEGIDLAAPTGTPIHASDGGRIIKANYWSGHGLCVEVDHGNGVITRYSHCSAVFVSIGDLVYQGQHIANVGNTGHSFGSHCHFEVRVNGTSQNPRNYINP